MEVMVVTVVVVVVENLISSVPRYTVYMIIIADLQHHSMLLCLDFFAA